MKKIIIIVTISLVLIVLSFAGFVALTWDKKFDAPYPEITASNDPQVIAHGKHLVFGAAHCSGCHISKEKLEKAEPGVDLPLSGGWELSIPPGTFRAPNLTPHSENGIGRLKDEEIARVMRYSVGDDGRPIFPFMPFQNMSDEDVTAIISYLRSQTIVNSEIKATEYTAVGKAVISLGMIKPAGPTGVPPKSVPIEASIQYGGYLANSVANCVGCHTNRDLFTGAYTGEPFAGGMTLPPDETSKGYTFVTPNLTPDKKTGVMANWTEEDFIHRFHAGRIVELSPMPWENFSRMNEIELKALYRYLHSLDPVTNSIAKVAYAPGEEVPD